MKPMEEMSNTCSRPGMIESRKARPQQKEQKNCPRCNSTNTKFCYYNNYSLTQPRYFCKTCRRYWTEGGSLRNVPVGGGSRKNKRSSSSSSITTSSGSAPAAKKISDHHHPSQSQSQNPKIHQGHDLNLGFPVTERYSTLSEFLETPNTDNNNNNRNPSLSALELLRTGITSRGLNSFMPMPIPIPDSNTNYSSGFSLQEFKPNLNFGVDGIGTTTGYGSLQGAVQESNGHGHGRLLFPFEDLRQVSSTSEFEQHRGHAGDSGGYWSGMLGGGSW